MAEIVRFPRRREVQKTEPKARRAEVMPADRDWAVLVPFGTEACEPFQPLAVVREETEPPDEPAS